MSSPRGYGHDTKTLKIVCAFDHDSNGTNEIEKLLRTEFTNLDVRVMRQDLTIFVRIDANTLNSNEVLKNW